MRIPSCSRSAAATHFIRRELPTKGRWRRHGSARAVTMMGRFGFPKPRRIRKSDGVLFLRSNSSRYWMGDERKRHGSSETSYGGMPRVYGADHLFISRFFRPAVLFLSFFPSSLPASHGEILSNDQFSLNQIRLTASRDTIQERDSCYFSKQGIR